MSTTAPTQVDSDSIDVTGVSVATSTPNVANPRLGRIYDPAVFAAAAPVWFHPVHDGSYLMVSARRWFSGTPVGGNPGVYSAHSEDLAPSWTLLDGPSGHRFAVPGFGVDIPITTTTDAPPTLVAAASRAPDYLYLLHSALINTVEVAILQRIRVAISGAVTVAAEEVLPSVTAGADTVVFDAGLQYDTPYLHLYGTDTTGAVYRMRKSWAAVGSNRSSSRFTITSGSKVAGLESTWQYFHGTGFSTDPTEVAPLPTITTAGPMSFSAYRTGVLITTVNKSGSTYSGIGWLTRAGKPMTRVGPTVALGSSSDGSYLGGGIQLQPQLGANPAAAAMTAGVGAGIPYVVWTKATPSGNATLNTTWNIWPITI